MPPVGNGIDVVEVQRIERLLTRQGEKFLNRVFTKAEVEHCMKKVRPEIHLAARFAAKEAAAKALGTGFSKGVRMRDIEVSSDGDGPPRLILHRAAAKRYDNIGGTKTLLSLTHTRELAFAHVIIS